MTTNTETHHN